MRRGWEERNRRRRRRETIRGGEGEETLTANIHPPHPANRLVKHIKCAAGADVAVARRKTEIRRGDEGKGENLEEP